jgi:hypothetical protein
MLGMGIEPMLGPHLGHTVYKTVGASSYTNPAEIHKPKPSKSSILSNIKNCFIKHHSRQKSFINYNSEFIDLGL